MTLEDRPMIEERDHLVSTQDHGCFKIAPADLAEQVVGPGQLSGLCHGTRLCQCAGGGAKVVVIEREFEYTRLP